MLARIPPMRAAVEVALATGQFVRDAQLPYEFLSHFDTVDDFVAYNDSQPLPLVLNSESLRHARDLFAGATEDAQLVMRVRRRLTRYKRSTHSIEGNE